MLFVQICPHDFRSFQPQLMIERVRPRAIGMAFDLHRQVAGPRPCAPDQRIQLYH